MPTAKTPDLLAQKETAAPRRPYIRQTFALAALLFGSMSAAAFAAGPPTGPIPTPIDASTIQGLLNSQMETSTAAQAAPAPAAQLQSPAPAVVATPEPPPATPKPTSASPAPVVKSTTPPAPAPATTKSVTAAPAAKAVAILPTPSGGENYSGKPKAIDPSVIRGFAMPSGSTDAKSAEPAPTEPAELAAARAPLAVVSSPEPAAPAPSTARAVPESVPQPTQPVSPVAPAVAPEPAPAAAAPMPTAEPAPVVQSPSGPASQPEPIDSSVISSFTGAQRDAAAPATSRPLPSSQLELIEKVFAPEQSQ